VAEDGGTLDYTGTETSVPENSVRPASSSEYFQIVSGKVPAGAIPVFDDAHHVAIGYRTPYVGGIARVYDLEGRQVYIEELPLETPLFDPIDLILIVGSVGRIIVRGLTRAGAEVASEVAAKAASRALSVEGASILRVIFRSIMQRELRFTATTAARMAQPGRFVPIQILKLAVRYGVRDADPAGVAGAFRYSIKVLRASKVIGKPAKEYMLRIVVRESDGTILHFHME